MMAHSEKIETCPRSVLFSRSESCSIWSVKRAACSSARTIPARHALRSAASQRAADRKQGIRRPLRVTGLLVHLLQPARIRGQCVTGSASGGLDSFAQQVHLVRVGLNDFEVAVDVEDGVESMAEIVVQEVDRGQAGILTPVLAQFVEDQRDEPDLTSNVDRGILLLLVGLNVNLLGRLFWWSARNSVPPD